MTTYSLRRHQSRYHRMAATAGRLSRSFFLKALMVLAIVIFSGSYLYKINNTSTTGYVIQDLDVKVRDLERENQRLSLEVAKYSSMHTIKKRIGELGLTEAKDVEYLTAGGSVVAKR